MVFHEVLRMLWYIALGATHVGPAWTLLAPMLAALQLDGPVMETIIPQLILYFWPTLVQSKRAGKNIPNYESLCEGSSEFILRCLDGSVGQEPSIGSSSVQSKLEQWPPPILHANCASICCQLLVEESIPPINLIWSTSSEEKNFINV